MLALPDLIKEMKSVKGVGNYAAENLLKLIGRYDGLALDLVDPRSVCPISQSGRPASDKKSHVFILALIRGAVWRCGVT